MGRDRMKGIDLTLDGRMDGWTLHTYGWPLAGDEDCYCCFLILLLLFLLGSVCNPSRGATYHGSLYFFPLNHTRISVLLLHTRIIILYNIVHSALVCMMLTVSSRPMFRRSLGGVCTRS